MKIEIAKTAGFCMGVRRAVELALASPGKYALPIFTYGPLIHNPQVLSLFVEKGITILNEIPEKGEGTVLIRAHGVPPADKQKLADAGFTVVDATCPRVIRVQTIIRTHARKGFSTIIVGDQDHPEVVGLMGYAGTSGYGVSTLSELEALASFDRAIIVAQTTQNLQFYEQVKAWAARQHPHYRTFDTICDSTERRQSEIQRLAKEVDALIVVGGRQSGNTRRLAEIAAETGKPAFHVETEADLVHCPLGLFRTIGITAGASTPNWIIKRVCRKVEWLSVSRKNDFPGLISRSLQSLMLSNIYLAMGAGCLTFACSRLLGTQAVAAPVMMAMLYLFSMHLLNHLTGTAEDKYNDPERARFYETHRIGLSVLAAAAGTGGIAVSATLGVSAFVILLIMSLLGLSYSLYLIPPGKGFKFRRIKDIPGSKTILIALAWGVVTVLLPAMSDMRRFSSLIPGVLVVFPWVTALVFSRTALFDLLDVQGDRIVGKETLPTLLGDRRTLVLLKGILAACTVLIALSAAVGLTSTLGFLLTLCPAMMLVLVMIHEQGELLPGMRFEVLVESIFPLSGVLAWIWMLF
ncbi:4-hydroxy-3-methylbut-2-enyl diphosphate reductase [Desulfosarcina sp. OttesenSCG-928-A07]|nr:4-hydroxy-3-methylbut-2-enyl diphosphate reductase [Desulfosarcina sp. OttesenSCG-928-G17]MDL2328173.1 4-hydroxy-3-methylbut-2-enyl diphosphate reductase [Desulfosarcina sp. OttesenSCG-928-A07]